MRECRRRGTLPYPLRGQLDGTLGRGDTVQGDSTPMVLPSLPTQPSEVKERGRGDKNGNAVLEWRVAGRLRLPWLVRLFFRRDRALRQSLLAPPVSCAPRAQRSTPPATSPCPGAPPMLHASPHCTAPASTLTKTRTHDRTLNVRDLTRSSHAAYAPAHAHAPHDTTDAHNQTCPIPNALVWGRALGVAWRSSDSWVVWLAAGAVRLG